MICQELSHQDTVRECQGQSFLVQGFGEGEFCTCGEVSIPGVPRTCPCCVQEKVDWLAVERQRETSEHQGTSALDARDKTVLELTPTGQVETGSSGPPKG